MQTKAHTPGLRPLTKSKKRRIVIGVMLIVVGLPLVPASLENLLTHKRYSCSAIERLHEEDREATLSDSADQLAKLWDKDAVRFPAGRPAEIGAAVIYADDKRWEMSSGRERSLCYDNEIQDVQIAGDWAFEWWYGSYKTYKDGKVSIVYGKGLRVMKRQSDGTWRFARVMSLPAPSASAVVLQHPCQ